MTVAVVVYVLQQGVIRKKLLIIGHSNIAYPPFVCVVLCIIQKPRLTAQRDDSSTIIMIDRVFVSAGGQTMYPLFIPPAGRQQSMCYICTHWPAARLAGSSIPNNMLSSSPHVVHALATDIIPSSQSLFLVVCGGITYIFAIYSHLLSSSDCFACFYKKRTSEADEDRRFTGRPKDSNCIVKNFWRSECSSGK